MADNYQFGSQFNTFIPTIQSSLIVDYTRNASAFPVNRYCEVLPVQKTVGYYRKFRNEDQSRSVNSPSDFVWADGNEAPQGNLNNNEFQFPQYRCARVAFPFRVGYLAADQADWDYIAVEAQHKAAQAMTQRTILVDTLLSTSGNWPAASTATATALGGGAWSSATSTNPYIRKSLMAAVNKIVQQTNGLVQYSDLRMVLNPTAAETIATSQEFIDFIKQAPQSLDIWTGTNMAARYHLPSHIYGIEVIVEDTPYVSTYPETGANPGTRGFVWPDTVVTLVTKKQVTSAAEGSFSTATIFSYSKDEMAVEVFSDQVNRVYKGRVIFNQDQQLVAAESGFCITAITG